MCSNPQVASSQKKQTVYNESELLSTTPLRIHLDVYFGENAIPPESAHDHKRVGDGDTSPNTGGMGAYSPAPVLTKELQDVVMETIIHHTVKGMSKEGCKFVGVLFAGLMIEKKSGLPKLIEFNVRFGDLECQVLMMRLESDIAKVLLAACRGELSGVSLDWSKDSAMVVEMASKGTDLDSEGNVVASGGRVLGVTAKGKDLAEAHEGAYWAVEHIKVSLGVILTGELFAGNK